MGSKNTLALIKLTSAYACTKLIGFCAAGPAARLSQFGILYTLFAIVRGIQRPAPLPNVQPPVRGCRRDPRTLRIGEGLDFWKVADLKSGRRLLLVNQMKVPGRAWLEFTVEGRRLTVTSPFHPRGLWGKLCLRCRDLNGRDPRYLMASGLPLRLINIIVAAQTKLSALRNHGESYIIEYKIDNNWHRNCNSLSRLKSQNLAKRRNT